jgi:hypothetical protein
VIVGTTQFIIVSWRSVATLTASGTTKSWVCHIVRLEGLAYLQFSSEINRLQNGLEYVRIGLVPRQWGVPPFDPPSRRSFPYATESRNPP